MTHEEGTYGSAPELFELRGRYPPGLAVSETLRRRPDPEVVAEAVRRVVRAVHPRRIILFGSAARGDMGLGSDLDLLVEVRGPANRLHLAQDIYVGLAGIGFAVDIVVATTEDLRAHRDDPGMIYGPALEEGKVVYAE